jgi:hypothetical protein
MTRPAFLIRVYARVKEAICCCWRCRLSERLSGLANVGRAILVLGPRVT